MPALSETEIRARVFGTTSTSEPEDGFGGVEKDAEGWFVRIQQMKRKTTKISLRMHIVSFDH